LNLAHRGSREAPTPLTPGEPTTVSVELEVTSWVFEAGHRVRLDLAGTDWPNAWPPPGPLTLTIERGRSALVLPELGGPSPVAERPTLAPPRKPQAAGESARGDELEQLEWRIEHDVLGRETRAIARYGGPSSADGVAPALDQRYGGTVGVSIDDPGRAWVESAATYRLEFPEATVSTSARSSVRSDREAYDVRIEIEAAEEGAPPRRRTFARRIPRRLQ
jgi:uncharacterized protein